MRSVIISCPRSIVFSFTMTCLVSAALALQISSGEASSILAKSPEPETKINTGPVVGLLPVAYRSFEIKKGEEKRSLSQLRTEIGEKAMPVVLKLNRLDEQHLHGGITLVIPKQIDELITYSPFPHEIETARDIPKILIVSRRVQAFGAYESGKLVRWGPTSTGKKETPTPAGLYHTNWKAKATRSSVNAEWLLPWYFNIDNKTRMSSHISELARSGRHHC